MHIPERSPDSPAHQTWSEVVAFDDEGNLKRGRVEESDAVLKIHKIRNELGHLITVKASRTFTLEEAEAIVESWKDLPDDRATESEKSETEPRVTVDTGIRIALLIAVVIIAFLLMRPVSEPEPAPVVKTEKELAVERINARNLKIAPVSDACLTLKELKKANEADLRILFPSE